VPFPRFDARDQRGEWCGAAGVDLGEGIVALAWITGRNSTLVLWVPKTYATR
jgi:hypothetical protein